MTLRNRFASLGRTRKARQTRPAVEQVESRLVLSTFTVANLNDSGFGSLRQAITDANGLAGPDTIEFTTNGTVQLTSAALPAVTDPVDINGTTSPGYLTRPVFEIDANGFAGLSFDVGSPGSKLRSIGVVNASNAGVTLNSSNNLVVGNNIGLRLNGSTTGGNAGDGILISGLSTGNTIGATTTVMAGSVLPAASNLISSNGGNGINVVGGSNNLIIANYVGTDLSGTQDRGNGGSGVAINFGAHDNTLGGVIPFVNTQGLVPHSNLISGNQKDGVRISGASPNNRLSANFIGTDLTGNAPLGNEGNGLSIVEGSNGNVLEGTDITHDPFIFANIISGNHANGMVVQDSNNTIIHANFFGLGYNNQTPVGNTLDGVLLAGTSKNVIFGGKIPLGNVTAANGGNGVQVRDSVSGLVAFNTFAGLAAFKDYTNLGNHLNGFLITSTGDNNLLRTNVISNNALNGVELNGNATGVQITDDIIGLNTDGKSPMPNGGNGILVAGNASNNIIGGALDEFSIIPHNVISSNLGHGVAFIGTAHNNLVLTSDIGTDIRGGSALGNAGAGILLGPGTFANTIGSIYSFPPNVISGNLGNGIELVGTTGNVITSNLIGTNFAGIAPILNGGNGIFIQNSSNNLIGGTATGAGNVIAFNAGAGVFINSGTGNAILGNSIYQNQNAGIVLQPGANTNQVPPLLTHIKRAGKQTGVGGVIRSAANSTYRVEFFSNTGRATRTPGGQTYLGSTVVTTNSQGFARIKFYTPTVKGLRFYTATATSASNDTSSFSNGVPQPVVIALRSNGRAV